MLKLPMQVVLCYSDVYNKIFITQFLKSNVKDIKHSLTVSPSPVPTIKKAVYAPAGHGRGSEGETGEWGR